MDETKRKWVRKRVREKKVRDGLKDDVNFYRRHRRVNVIVPKLQREMDIFYGHMPDETVFWIRDKFVKLLPHIVNEDWEKEIEEKHYSVSLPAHALIFWDRILDIADECETRPGMEHFGKHLDICLRLPSQEDLISKKITKWGRIISLLILVMSIINVVLGNNIYERHFGENSTQSE